jgi:hypothetical protein
MEGKTIAGAWIENAHASYSLWRRRKRASGRGDVTHIDEKSFFRVDPLTMGK